MSKLMILAVVIVAAFVIFGVAQPGYITGSAIKNEEQKVQWQGIDMTMQAAVFATGYGEAGKSSVWSICGQDDGKVQIGNTYTPSTVFKMTSTISSSGKACQGNYIRAIAEFPAGTLKGHCDLQATAGKTEYGRAECYIREAGSERFSAKAWKLGGGEYGEQPNVQKDFEIILDKPTKLEIEAVVDSAYTGISTATVDFSFTPKVDAAPTTTATTTAGQTLPSQVGSVVADSRNFLEKIWDWIKGVFT